MRHNSCMHIRLISAAFLLLASFGVWTQSPASQKPEPRPTAPVRDPHTPGYIAAQELADGALPPANADGNFILGPTHKPALEMQPDNELHNGSVIEFTMSSADSKLYPGITREPGTFGTPNPKNPAKLFWVSPLRFLAATGDAKCLTKANNALVRYVLGYPQPTRECVVKREQQSLTSVSLDMVEQLCDRASVGKLAQADTNVR